MLHLYTLWGHLLQPAASWKRALQQIEPSSSSFFSGLPSLAHAQKPLTVLPLSQSVQAGPGLVQSAPVSAQKFEGVHDVLHGVHRFSQTFQNVHVEFSQISTWVSWMKRVSV